MAAPVLSRRLTVETPEHIELEFELAGLGSRAAAALIDLLIVGGLESAWGLGFAVLAMRRGTAGAWAAALGLLVAFAIWYGYFSFFEGLRGGQTPGKRRMGIRVVADTGHAASLGAAFLRNLLRIADFLPPPYVLGAALVLVHPRAKRLGDLVAGTVVVRDQPLHAPATAPAPAGPAALDAPELSDEELRVLGSFVERAPALASEARERLAATLTLRLRKPLERLGSDAGDPVARLGELHRCETGRREGRLGARGAAASGAGARLAARQRERWNEFAVLAERVSRGRLDALRAEEITDFAARYREIAADLARLRTYGADPMTLLRVERLVAAGHGALYRSERQGLRAAARLVAREFPAAVVQSWKVVLAACLCFSAPAAVGYTLLRTDPGLAPRVLSDTMLDRAEAGHERIARGEGYVEVAAGVRPLMASAIIANNLRVAFYCFAGGIFLGVGSFVLLAWNGLQLGTTAGHFANRGLLGYLLPFIVGHGVLELFAICLV